MGQHHEHSNPGIVESTQNKGLVQGFALVGQCQLEALLPSQMVLV